MLREGVVLIAEHINNQRKSAAIAQFALFFALRIFCVFFAVCQCQTVFCAENATYGSAKSTAPPVWSQIITHETRATTKLPPQQPSKQWIFDQSSFTNSPKTGKRVLQYERGTPAYRDPNAFYDSPHESYPFSPAPYGPYPRFAPPRYYGDSAYDQYSFPYRPYAALPTIF